SIACYRGDDSVRTYSANAMVAGIGNIETAIRTQCNPMWQVQLRLVGRTIVAAVTANPVSRYGSNHSIESDTANPVVERIGDIDTSVRSHSDSTRVPELRLTSLTSVTAIPGAPATRCGRDRTVELLDPLNPAPAPISEVEHPAGRLIGVVHT